jgi:hypothetical protein
MEMFVLPTPPLPLVTLMTRPLRGTVVVFEALTSLRRDAA